ncbi:MAG: type II toxin-antitoxin system RelE/ParE family toxin [Nanoarchaeota archaeon]|nr:type II toxin-antitoxin system RelE/ParE family toxin [Nanoarchaeota archaeon]
MNYEILFHKKAQTFFNKLDNSTKKQISIKIDKLKSNPELGKPLVGNLFGLRSLRVEKFRILYEIKKSQLIIYVLEIGHRKNVYD